MLNISRGLFWLYEFGLLKSVNSPGGQENGLHFPLGLVLHQVVIENWRYGSYKITSAVSENTHWVLKHWCGPGWLAQLLRASSPYTKAAGSNSGEGTCKKQPMNASINGTTNRCLCLSLSFSSFLFKINQPIKHWYEQNLTFSLLIFIVGWLNVKILFWI